MRKRIPNEYITLDDNTTILRITSETHGVVNIMIDTIYVNKCKMYGWSINKYRTNSNTGRYYLYVVNKKAGLLHRYITDAPKGMVVDHINGDTLDNTLKNLQVCRKIDNERKSRKPLNNTSGVLGVTYNKSLNKWMSYIKVNYKFKNLGYYDDINEAKKVRKIAEEKYFGKYKPINERCQEEVICMNKFEGFEYTEDGYIRSNGQYIGLKDDNDWEWYGNIDLVRKKLKPIINMAAIQEIKEYVDFVQNL